MHKLRLFLAIPILAAGAVPAAAGQPIDPLGFFEGRTEGEGTIKVILRQPYTSRTVSHGRFERDGSLTLVQTVSEDGKPPQQRRWNVRRAGPNRFTGTMSEAVGPVIIDRISDRYRFRFKLKDNLSAEQWLTPLPGGRSARNSMAVRKLGVVVARSSGFIRKV